MCFYATFADLTKAFDTVSRKGLWQILERLGCPRKFLNMVIQLHEGQRGQIRLEGDLSESFPYSNGVKQGVVLAPTLFSTFFSMMLKQVNKDLQDEDGVYVRYRLDGSLFNIRRFQAHTKTHERLIRDLLCPGCPHRRCLRWSCMANSPQAIVTEGYLRNATKTASRSLSMCVT